MYNLGVVEGRMRGKTMGTKDRREGNPTRRRSEGVPRVKEDDPWMSSFVWGQTNTSCGSYCRRRRGNEERENRSSTDRRDELGERHVIWLAMGEPGRKPSLGQER